MRVTEKCIAARPYMLSVIQNKCFRCQKGY